MDKKEKLKFVEMANPHSWYLTADNLHEQALFLRKSDGRSRLTYIGRDGSTIWWDGGNRSTFLLGGFALENTLKAFLVYENPEWISNGTLGGPLRSHSLTMLQPMSKTVPYKNRMLWVLSGFEEGLESLVPLPLCSDRASKPSGSKDDGDIVERLCAPDGSVRQSPSKVDDQKNLERPSRL